MVYFLIFDINRFSIALLHNNCQDLDFGVKFNEIFVIENRLPAVNDPGVASHKNAGLGFEPWITLQQPGALTT